MHFPPFPPIPDYPPPGNVVWVRTHLLWRHRGVVSGRWHQGAPMVISASARAGRVCEEPWELFSGGNPVFKEGYPSDLPAGEVLRRARALIDTKYDILTFNCDHFVARAHGAAAPRSAQLEATLALALVAVVVRIAAKR